MDSLTLEDEGISYSKYQGPVTQQHSISPLITWMCFRTHCWLLFLVSLISNLYLH